VDLDSDDSETGPWEAMEQQFTRRFPGPVAGVEHSNRDVHRRGRGRPSA
jgi:hypothetical protein